MAVTVRRRVEGAFKFGVEPIGPRDGTNRTYATPEKFRAMIGFYRNGVKLLAGGSADYIIEESGGPGTGYDTIIFVPAAPPPTVEENLQVDYIQQ